MTPIDKKQLLNDLYEYIDICNDNINYLSYQNPKKINIEHEIELQECKKLTINNIITAIESNRYDIE